ncbi:MAG TPA: PocR ligand-binding domain-containing protein, partial [Pyrinomonadaceae bacterium]|nr:PocR ligand-binding domain-containing protein [Pyrinomonadaceae bacterium]
MKENSRTAAQSALAEKNGLAILFVDEKASVLTEANNNSICRVLYSSEEFAPECDKYCGRAFQMAEEAGGIAAYRCHAGLDCRAVPVKDAGKPRLVAIVGRVFTKAENYRAAAERAADGDWSKFPPTELFENVLLTGSTANLDAAAGDLENLSDRRKAELFENAANAPTAESITNKTQTETATAKIETEKASQSDQIARLVEKFHNATARKTALVADNFTKKNTEEAEQIAEWRALFGSLLNLTYKKACDSILRFLSKRYRLESLAWLERRENRFEIVVSEGKLKDRRMQLGIPADDARLVEAARREISIELRERKTAEKDAETQAIRLFPIAVGGEIRSGLLMDDRGVDENKQRQIARFCQAVASELEILRLREELSRRGWLARAVQKFNENVREIDSEDFWLNLAQIFAELMKAERSSLMIFDEKSDSLVVKAAIGLTADMIKAENETLGDRVATQVLTDGKPLVVEDVEKTKMRRAP